VNYDLKHDGNGAIVGVINMKVDMQ